MTTELYGYFKLSESEKISEIFDKKLDEIVRKGKEDSRVVAKVMRDLIDNGLSEDTVVWIYGRSIEVENYREGKVEHGTLITVVTDLVGSLKKTKSGEVVNYKGLTKEGVEVEFTAVPPGCRVEEREELIPAEPERIVKKRILICDGPGGTTEEIVE